MKVNAGHSLSISGGVIALGGVIVHITFILIILTL